MSADAPRIFVLTCATKGCEPTPIDGDALRARMSWLSCPRCLAGEWPHTLSITGPDCAGVWLTAAPPRAEPRPVQAGLGLATPETPKETRMATPIPAGVDRAALREFMVEHRLLPNDKRMVQVNAWQRLGLVRNRPDMQGSTVVAVVQLTPKGLELVGAPA